MHTDKSKSPEIECGAAAGFKPNERATGGDERIAYGAEEFAKLVGLGRTSIFEAIRRQELRSILVGRRRLILAADGMRWLESAASVACRHAEQQAAR